MIVEVYPIRRLPRSMSILDYSVPDKMQLKRGSLVEVPFRTKKIFAIVRRVKEIPQRGLRLKTVFSVIQPQALSEKELSFFESIAHQIVQPVSHLFLAHIPSPVHTKKTKFKEPAVPLPLTVPSLEAETISRISTQLTKRRKAFAQVPDLRRTAAIIAGYSLVSHHEKIIVVCPHIHDVKILADALASFHPLTITGKESKGQRFDVWQRYRKAEEGLLITTRVGMLFADQKTTSIFVVRSGHPDHVLHRRHPRLNTRQVMEEFSDLMMANCFFLDVFPRPEDFHRFGQENILTYPITPQPIFIDVSHERNASPHPVLTSSCMTAIESTLARNERVLLIYNKKGYAYRLSCESCAHQVVCHRCQHVLRVHQSTVSCQTCKTIEPTPLACPSCQKQTLNARGYGMERLVEALKQFFPHSPCQIIDAEHLTFPKSPLVLVTRAFLEQVFQPTKKYPFGCVIHLDPDTALFSPDFRSSQRAVWSLAEWWGLAHAVRSPFYVQTNEKEFFEQQLFHPEQMGPQELTRRQEYEQPPFVCWVLIRLKESERRKRETEQYILKDQLEQIDHVLVSILDSKKQDEALIQVKFPHSCTEMVLKYFSGLDDRYIIDINAYQG